MIETIYIEEEVRDHSRVRAILQRFPHAQTVTCTHYGEVFNRRAQNFRLQKQQPSLILSAKKNRRVLEAPPGYGIGGERNFYLSHMMNCIYDCRSCFLQGMYRSAHYVLFVNYEDYLQDIIETVQANAGHTTHFFSGYDCDSLALEPVTFFAKEFVPIFRDLPGSLLELRTKSTQVRHLAEMEVIPNVVVAFSFSPQNIVQALEHKTPSLTRRVEAMQKLAERGWKVGLRFDPVIYCENYQKQYADMMHEVFSAVPVTAIHSVSLGAFRLPENFFENTVKLYPYEPLFANHLASRAGMVAYEHSIENDLLQFCEDQLLQYVPRTKYFPCRYDD